jgi:hypothetical protein
MRRPFLHPGARALESAIREAAAQGGVLAHACEMHAAPRKRESHDRAEAPTLPLSGPIGATF